MCSFLSDGFLNTAALACLNRDMLEFIPCLIHVSENVKRPKGVKEVIPGTDTHVHFTVTSGRKVEKTKGKKMTSKSYAQSI